jgi:hypothetical protein
MCTNMLASMYRTSHHLEKSGFMPGNHIMSSDMCRDLIMHANRPDPICRPMRTACPRRAPAARTLPCPCTITLLVRTLLVAVPHRSFSSAGSNIVPSTVDAPKS